MSYQEIAEKFVLSVATVKFHVSSILAKLTIMSGTVAVALVLQEKLLA